MPQELEHPRGWRPSFSPRRLVEPELLHPHYQRSPHQLVHTHDHRHHRDDGERHRRDVPLIERHTHVGADARQAKIAVSQAERFVDHEEEPAPGHREHPVPHEALRRARHLELPERPRGAPPRDLAGVAQRVGEGLERIVKGERQIPGLRREDHQDRRELETNVARGEQ